MECTSRFMGSRKLLTKNGDPFSAYMPFLCMMLQNEARKSRPPDGGRFYVQVQLRGISAQHHRHGGKVFSYPPNIINRLWSSTFVGFRC